MKKRNPRTKNKSRGSLSGTSALSEPPPRRDIFAKCRSIAVAVLAVGAVSWYLVAEVMATIQEQDLSRIGNGIPTVVQIHDPQCPLCTALQKESREALRNFEDGELQFLVADIRGDEGRRFASAHRVRHVTLLLFDAAGRRRNVVVGPNESEYLTVVFRSLVNASKIR
jgi:hypothetical protein